MPLIYKDGVFTYKHKGGAEEVVELRYSAGVAAVGRTAAVAASAGKRNRLVGAVISSTTAAGIATVSIVDAPGGVGGSSMINGLQAPLNTSTDPNIRFPQQPCGYGDTTLSNGIYIDVIAQTVYFSIWYVQYTPT